MADSWELILQVRPASGDDARELAKLAGWLRGELLDLDVQGVDRLSGEAAPVGANGSADTAGLLLVRLDPNVWKVVQAKVAEWGAESGRVVEIHAGGHTLTLRPPTQALVPPGESLPVPWSPPEGGELARRNRLAEACLLVRGEIDIEALPEEESRRTAVFAVISSLLGIGLAVLLSIAILAITRRFHGFSISTSYPVHRVYHQIVRYFIGITPPPGSSHMLLVYTVYLAVVPVLFAVVFVRLKVGSIWLVVAAVACVTFMAAPFIIAVTSIRVGPTNCGSWNYPALNAGPECYNDLETAFRIAFAAGIVGLAVPIIYLIRGRRDGHENGLLLGALIACATAVMVVFRFISKHAQRQAGGTRDVASRQKATAGINQYLLPHEQQVIKIRRHPAVLIGPIVLALAGLVAAVVLTATLLRGDEPLIIAVWIACLVLFIRIIWKAIDWSVTFFVITSQRMLLASGVLTRNVAMLPLVKVTDMTFQRSYTGRLLGFGEFIIESAGQDQALSILDHIPYPEQLYLEVCGLLFLDRSEG